MSLFGDAFDWTKRGAAAMLAPVTGGLSMAIPGSGSGWKTAGGEAMGGISSLFGGGTPDYMKLAQQQSDMQNKMLQQQTQANRPNQNTPFGHSNWTQDANGNWTQNTGFSPEMQQKYDSIMGQWQSQLNKGPMDVGAYQKQAQDALYNKQSQMLDPMFRNQQNTLNSSLANQGLDPNSGAARMQQDQFSREKTGAYGNAQLNSILGGGQEANRMFGMDMANRMMPMQEMNSLFGLGKMPGFMGAGEGQAPNLMGAAQANQQNSNDQMKAYMQLLGMGAQMAPMMFGG